MVDFADQVIGELSFGQRQKGPFQPVPVLQAFSVYYTHNGIQSPPPFSNPGEDHYPIGALALAATAVSVLIVSHHSSLTCHPRLSEDT